MTLFLALLSLLSLVDPADKMDRLNIKGPLTFQGKNFELAWTSHPTDEFYIQGYLPAGEKPETFHEMMSVHLLRNDAEPHLAVMEKMKALETRKTTDAVCQYSLIESPDGKEFILDFVMSESKDDKVQLVEFNIYRYKQIEIGGKKALLTYIYSKRAYGEEVTPLFEWLGTQRTEVLNKMIETSLPAPATP
jgi:hypothetical protein